MLVKIYAWRPHEFEEQMREYEKRTDKLTSDEYEMKDYMINIVHQNKRPTLVFYHLARAYLHIVIQKLTHQRGLQTIYYVRDARTKKIDKIPVIDPVERRFHEESFRLVTETIQKNISILNNPVRFKQWANKSFEKLKK